MEIEISCSSCVSHISCSGVFIYGSGYRHAEDPSSTDDLSVYIYFPLMEYIPLCYCVSDMLFSTKDSIISPSSAFHLQGLPVYVYNRARKTDNNKKKQQ